MKFLALIFWLLYLLLFSSCQSEQENSYNRIKLFIDNIKVVDTHEHHISDLVNPPRNIEFFRYMFYFNCDLMSAGWHWFANAENETDEIWRNVEKYYKYSCAKSYHDQLVYGYKILYDYDKPYFTKEDVIDLENRVRENYMTNYRQWFKEAFEKGNFEVMMVYHSVISARKIIQVGTVITMSRYLRNSTWSRGAISFK